MSWCSQRRRHWPHHVCVFCSYLIAVGAALFWLLCFQRMYYFCTFQSKTFTVCIFYLGIRWKSYCEAWRLKGLSKTFFRVCSKCCVIVQYIIVHGKYHVQKCTVQWHSIFESQKFQKNILYCTFSSCRVFWVVVVHFSTRRGTCRNVLDLHGEFLIKSFRK